MRCVLSSRSCSRRPPLGATKGADKPGETPRCHRRPGDDPRHRRGGEAARDAEPRRDLRRRAATTRSSAASATTSSAAAPAADLIHGGRGNDTVDGGAGDFDQRDRRPRRRPRAGRPRRRRRGGRQPRHRHRQRRPRRLRPGPRRLRLRPHGRRRRASGDIASFATDVGAGKGGGVKVSLAKHKARGDGHDRLFRFEALEGSAFDDILVGNKQAQRDRRRSRQGRRCVGGGGPDTLERRRGRATSCKGRQRTDRPPAARKRSPKASAYVEVDFTPGGGGGLAIVGRGGPDHFVVAFDADAEVFGVTAPKRGSRSAPAAPARRQPDPGLLHARRSRPAG